MIEENVKIHDNFSAEFKVGFMAEKPDKVSDFALNIWMFIPNGLDINRFTYSKTNFYRDLKSNIRQITPVWGLDNLCAGEKSPYALLRKSLLKFENQPDENGKHDFEFHIKMFQSILKSALRERVNSISLLDETEQKQTIVLFVENIRSAVGHYRSLHTDLQRPYLHKALNEYFRFGDEFMSNAIEYQIFRLMEHLRKKSKNVFDQSKQVLLQLIEDENNYRKANEYLVVEPHAERNNHDLINRLNLLKKYIDSHLYLNIDKRKDGVLMEQLLFSLAAGLSMIFATAIAFSFQQRYGSFTMPLFVALVVSYMLKDRIKEMTRYYFAHKMGTRYFDHKATMHINETPIGWARESMDFVNEAQLPPEVEKVRDRTTLIEAHNRANSEKVLLYRLRMQLDPVKLNTNSEFETKGVNSIIRFNFSEFIRNMDNPQFDLYYPNAEDGFELIEGQKLYYINLVIEKQNGSQNEAHRYRIAINRNGIKRIRKL